MLVEVRGRVGDVVADSLGVGARNTRLLVGSDVGRGVSDLRVHDNIYLSGR